MFTYILRQERWSRSKLEPQTSPSFRTRHFPAFPTGNGVVGAVVRADGPIGDLFPRHPHSSLHTD